MKNILIPISTLSPNKMLNQNIWEWNLGSGNLKKVLQLISMCILNTRDTEVVVEACILESESHGFQSCHLRDCERRQAQCLPILPS